MYQTDFSPEEFRARRRKLCEAIGHNAVALLQSTPGHKVLLATIRPGPMVADIHAEVAEKMSEKLDAWEFASTAHREAARAMFKYRGHISHCVGLTVHDGRLHYDRPLEPGMVFSVDPIFRLPEEKFYYRVEDTVVVTEDGIENLTEKAPLELDDVEATMNEQGLLQSFPTK